MSVVAWPSASAEENPLDRYVAKPDRPTSTDCSPPTRAAATAYILEMTSQTFLTKADVDRTLWKHWVIIVKPTKYGTRPAC